MAGAFHIPHVGATSMRTLHRYQIDGISLLAYDDADSQACELGRLGVAS